MNDVTKLSHSPHPNASGTRAIIKFSNGYKASIVSGPLFYSTPNKPWEIAVLNSKGVVYDTPVTDDVCGYLTTEEANSILDQIEALPNSQEKKDE